MVAQGAKIPPFILVILPVLALIAVALLQFVSRFVFTTTISADGSLPSSGGVPAILNILSVLVGLIAILAAIPLALWWYYRYSRGAEYVTHSSMAFGLAFGLGILLNVFGFSFVMPGILQDAFNKISENDSNPPAESAYPNIGQQTPGV